MHTKFAEFQKCFNLLADVLLFSLERSILLAPRGPLPHRVEDGARLDERGLEAVPRVGRDGLPDVVVEVPPLVPTSFIRIIINFRRGRRAIFEATYRSTRCC